MLSIAMWTVALVAVLGLIAGLRQQRGNWNGSAVLVFVMAWVLNAPSLIASLTGYVIIRYEAAVQSNVRRLFGADDQIKNYLVLALALLAGCLAYRAVRRGRAPLHGVAVVALALCVTANLSNPNSGEPIFSSGAAALVAVFIAAAVLPKGPEAYLGAATFGVTFTAASALMAVLKPEMGTYDCRQDKCGPLDTLIPGVAESENALALALVVALPFVYLAFRGRVRFTLTACVSLMIYLSGNRTSLAAVAIVIALILVLKPGAATREAGRNVIAYCSIAALALVGLVLPHMSFVTPTTFTTRGYLWELGLRIVNQEAPWTGMGAAGWQHLFDRGLIARPSIYSAHNQWVDVQYAGGFLGLALFCWWLALIVRGGRSDPRALALILAPALAIGLTERAWAFGIPDWLTWSVLATMLAVGGTMRTEAVLLTDDLKPGGAVRAGHRSVGDALDGVRRRGALDHSMIPHGREVCRRAP